MACFSIYAPLQVDKPIFSEGRKRVDGTFLQAALKYKIDVRDDLAHFLGGKTKYEVPRQVVRELRALGDDMRGAFLNAKRIKHVEIEGVPEDAPARDAFRAAVKDANAARFIIATQDLELRHTLRTQCPGVPVLSLNKGVLVLDRPSPASEEHVRAQELAKGTASKKEQRFLQKITGVDPDEESQSTPKKRRGPAAPNPLSRKAAAPRAGKRLAGDVPEVSSKKRRHQKQKERRRLGILEREHVDDSGQSQALQQAQEIAAPIPAPAADSSGEAAARSTGTDDVRQSRGVAREEDQSPESNTDRKCKRRGKRGGSKHKQKLTK